MSQQPTHSKSRSNRIIGTVIGAVVTTALMGGATVEARRSAPSDNAPTTVESGTDGVRGGFIRFDDIDGES